jgi:hypothetical protein
VAHDEVNVGYILGFEDQNVARYAPYSDHVQGGPIVDRLRPNLTSPRTNVPLCRLWEAYDEESRAREYGETYLEAAMRLVVSRTFGRDLPAEGNLWNLRGVGYGVVSNPLIARFQFPEKCKFLSSARPEKNCR